MSVTPGYSPDLANRFRAENIGGLVIDGKLRFPIKGVELAKGEVVLHAVRKGPVAAWAGGKAQFEVYGVDGTICASVEEHYLPGWLAVKANTYLWIQFPIRITEMVPPQAKVSA